VRDVWSVVGALLLGDCRQMLLISFRLVMTFEIVTNMLTTGHTSCLEMIGIFFMLSIPSVI